MDWKETIACWLMPDIKIKLDLKDKDISDLKARIAEISLEKSELVQSINKLKDELKSVQDKLELHTKELVKFPEGSERKKSKYLGSFNIWTKAKSYSYKFKKMQHYFSFGQVLQDEVITPLLSPKLQPNSDFMKWKLALSYVQNNISYSLDKDKFGITENWEPPLNTYITKIGDCESMSMLVIAICKAWGVPAENIFMELGWYTDTKTGQKYGHAWTKFITDDGQQFIGESTSKLQPFRTTTERAKQYNPDWGLGNWKYELRWKNEPVDTNYVGNK